MNKFQVLLIKEHVREEVEKLDHRICILYDQSEDTYFYYGSRNNDSQNSYTDYDGYYRYEQKGAFVALLAFLMGEFKEVITTELHTISIPEHQYNMLSYKVLLSKMSNKTLLAAYDGKEESRSSITEYLNMLVQN